MKMKKEPMGLYKSEQDFFDRVIRRLEAKNVNKLIVASVDEFLDIADYNYILHESWSIPGNYELHININLKHPFFSYSKVSVTKILRVEDMELATQRITDNGISIYYNCDKPKSTYLEVIIAILPSDLSHLSVSLGDVAKVVINLKKLERDIDRLRQQMNYTGKE